MIGNRIGRVEKKPRRCRVQQQFKDECDVNNIVNNYTSGKAVPINVAEPIYADISGVPNDFSHCLNVVNDAKQKFQALPAKIRKRFSHDPAELLEFLMDENNREEAEELGMVVPRKKVEAINPNEPITSPKETPPEDKTAAPTPEGGQQ